ncbi:MAG: TA system VapC family ribonuclease toxin [Terriglobales bacterium]
MPRSSKSFLFPDVNVWLALSYDRHVHHSAAKDWLESVDSGARLCFCRFTQISFLRLLNTGAVMGEDGVLSQAHAWNAYDHWIEDGDAILLEEPAAIESSFRTFSQQTRPAPKDWADSYLAAFASVLGLKLVSFDQAFRKRVPESIILRPGV